MTTQVASRPTVAAPPPPAKRTHRRNPAKPIGGVVLTLVGTFLFLLPIIWIFTTSLKPTGEIFAIPPTLLPQSPTVEHFGEVLTGSSVLQLFANSLIVATGATAISLLLGVPAA